MFNQKRKQSDSPEVPDPAQAEPETSIPSVVSESDEALLPELTTKEEIFNAKFRYEVDSYEAYYEMNSVTVILSMFLSLATFLAIATNYFISATVIFLVYLFLRQEVYRQVAVSWAQSFASDRARTFFHLKPLLISICASFLIMGLVDVYNNRKRSASAELVTLAPMVVKATSRPVTVPEGCANLTLQNGVSIQGITLPAGSRICIRLSTS